jgi:outer membrane protein assembly factor BamB
VVAVALQWLCWLVMPIVPGWGIFGMIGGVLFGLVIVVWWLFFSRALWSERLGAIVLMVVAVAATSRIVHESIANGMMGMMLPMYSIPVLSLALVAWAVASRGLSTGLRRASMAASIVLACGTLTLIRTNGISGEGDSDLHWRWTPTSEERLLAQTADEHLALPSAPAPAPTPPTPKEPVTAETARELPVAKNTPATPAAVETDADRPAMSEREFTRVEWPGFRGPDRASIIRGAQIETDWSKSPPVELWRRKIGPAWSSFAVHGNVLYTQEQRGDDEIVAAYSVTTGEPVWRHRDAARFWESNAGAGPRGTPTVTNGRVYALGATGIVNALDARDGSVIWSRNAQSDTGAPMPGWGFASSPLVVNDVVIVAAAGRLAGYDVASGHPRWVVKTGGGGYSSPHLMTIGGVPQVLLLNGAGATSVAPADGTVLWQHSWPEGIAIVQPAMTEDGDVLISLVDSFASGVGTRRIAVAHGPGGWTTEERWTSTGLKPSFNDLVVHKGHAFGFDGSILACLDLENGKRNWKGGRYGHGQLLLLPDQNLLLVLSEDGELALVSATPDNFTELARIPAIEGKTWNHPVLVGDVLLIRNGEEMAAFRLSLAGR